MSAENKVALSIVIPAYNEEKRLPPSLRDIRAFFSQFPVPMEVLVMVESSKDRTLEAARAAVEGDPRFHIIDNEVHRGKGYAVRKGMQRAKGDYVFFMDADLSTPLAEVLAFLAHFQAHPDVDVLIGSRELAQSRIIKAQSRLRRSMGRTFNKFVQIFGVRGITDTQCGFKAFKQNACQEVFARQKLDGFAFDVEVLLLAQGLGYRIDVLPVRWVNSPDSKVHIVRDSLKMLRDLIKTRRIVRRSLREQPALPPANRN